MQAAVLWRKSPDAGKTWTLIASGFVFKNPPSICLGAYTKKSLRNLQWLIEKMVRHSRL